MEDHETPFLFEECFVKTIGATRNLTQAEISQNADLARKIDPTGGLGMGIEFQNEDSHTNNK